MTRANGSPWPTEAALCADFAATARERGWTVYPETAGWDLLLVDPGSGAQLGVEAKLIGGLEVLGQIVNRLGWRYHCDEDRGPDFAATLVGRPRAGFRDVVESLGVIVFDGGQEARARAQGGWGRRNHWHHLPAPRYAVLGWTSHHFHDQRESLPDFPPDVRAGVPSPVTLTLWRQAAIRICGVLRRRGYLVREDFRRAHVDPKRWLLYYLDRAGEGPPPEGFGSRPAMRFVARPGAQLPDEDYPALTAQVRAHDAAQEAR